MALYCSPCGNQRGWPTHYTSVARGNCEICGTDDILHDVNDPPTTTTDRDELVERLRLYYVIVGGKPWFSNKGKVHKAADLHDAVERVQADAATIARMREALNRTQADLAYIERMPTHGMNDQCYIEAMRRNISEAMGRVRSALKGGDQ